MSHDDDDNEEDFAMSFRRLVRATEKQIAIAESERHKVYGFEVEVSAVEMRSLLTEYAKLLRVKLDMYKDMPSQDEVSEQLYAQAHPAQGVIYDPKMGPSFKPDETSRPWKLGDSVRPHGSVLGQMELQAVWCIAWAAKLTDEKKVFRLSAHEWASIFGRPDVAQGYSL